MKLPAFAKVTLSLRVLGRRDDGFHDLEALTVSATEPHDTLELHDAATTTVTVTGPFAAGVPSDDDNLVARALHLLDRTMSVTLHKGIPPGAGLGGGSADAAAVLRAFGGSAEQAAALGSDVPFCFHGGPAWMRGRGETVEPIDALAPLDLVIVAPDFGCSTPAVYRAWDDLAGPVSSRAIDAPSGYPGPFGNDLEPAAEHVEPRLRAFREHVEEVLQRPALLCGSGSAVAAWFVDSASADASANRAVTEFGSTRTWRSRVRTGVSDGD